MSSKKVWTRSVPNGSDLRSRIVNGRSALPTNVFGPWKDERRCVPLFGKLGASRRLGFVQKDPFFLKFHSLKSAGMRSAPTGRRRSLRIKSFPSEGAPCGVASSVCIRSGRCSAIWAACCVRQMRGVAPGGARRPLEKVQRVADMRGQLVCVLFHLFRSFSNTNSV